MFIRFQRRGIGSRLLEAAEKAAASSGSAVTLGVGLHSGYGPAQRLYVKRGYIPDGSGVWFRDQPLDVCRLPERRRADFIHVQKA